MTPKDARLKRGWNTTQAVRRRPDIGEQSLKNLEGGPGSTRVAEPGQMNLRTILAIAELYYGDVNLRDLLGQACRWKLVPVDAAAGRSLAADAASHRAMIDPQRGGARRRSA